ncbi:MAG: twin-arginine translocase TatA/TatE family subunit [bacterium]
MTLTTPTLLSFIGNLGMLEWAVILIIALLLFGRRLPEVGKSLGQGIKEFKKGLKETEEEARKTDDSPSRRSLPQDQTMRTPESTQERTHTH